MGGFWVGADPGGKANFGLAFLYDATNQADSMTVSSVDEAVAEVARVAKVKNDEPQGLGTDGPLWWSTRGGGGRKVDEDLRRKCGISPGTVQSANSLRGAALVGAAMLVSGVREKFPGIGVTESHPKALLKAGFDSLLTEVTYHAKNVHERDAVLAAVCARKGLTRCWTRDLAKDLWPEEEDPLSPCFRLGPVHYYWPEPLPE